MQEQNYVAGGSGGTGGQAVQPQALPPVPPQPATATLPLVGVIPLLKQSFIYFGKNIGKLLSIFVIPVVFSVLITFIPKEAEMATVLAELALYLLSFLAYLAVFLSIKNSTGVLASYTDALKLSLGGFWIGLLSGLVVMGGFLLLVVPGLIFIVWLFPVMLVFVFEGKRGFNALLTSKSYVQGYFWPIFGRLFALGLIMWGAFIILLVPLAFTGTLGLMIGSVVLAFFSYPLTSIYTCYLYGELVRVKPTVASAPVNEKGRGLFIFVAILGILLPIVMGIVTAGIASLQEKARQTDLDVYNSGMNDLEIPADFPADYPY